MISLSGSSLLSKVGPPSRRDGRNVSRGPIERRMKRREIGAGGTLMGSRSTEEDADNRLETTLTSRRPSSIHQRPRLVLVRLFVRIPDTRYTSILGTFSYYSDVALRSIGHCSHFRWIFDFAGGCRVTLCSAALLYPG